MKRKWLVLLLLSLALCSGCSNIKKNNEESREAQEDKTIETVVKDVSGTKRDLKIDFVQNVGTEIKFLNITTDYSQVENGHYYYMRQIKKSIYDISRHR